ncbi:MAG: hypothetical protein J2P21_01590 [Chloracidobacterium sp.]|nr:hypothetical protein [Chloracidobacterium sp.]
MKNFWRIAQSVGFLCLIGSIGFAVLNFLAVIAASFGFTRPLIYFHYFGIHYWSVLAPALGILMLLPLALREAFMYRSAPEEEKLIEPMNWRDTVNRWRSRFHLRPV